MVSCLVVVSWYLGDTPGMSTPSRWTFFPTSCGSTSIARSSQQSGFVFPGRDYRNCARYTYSLSQRSITNPTSQARLGTFIPYLLGAYEIKIGFGLRRAPTQCKVWEEFRLSIVYFPVGVPFLSFGFYPKGVFPWRF